MVALKPEEIPAFMASNLNPRPRFYQPNVWTNAKMQRIPVDKIDVTYANNIINLFRPKANELRKLELEFLPSDKATDLVFAVARDTEQADLWSDWLVARRIWTLNIDRFDWFDSLPIIKKISMVARGMRGVEL